MSIYYNFFKSSLRLNEMNVRMYAMDTAFIYNWSGILTLGLEVNTKSTKIEQPRMFFISKYYIYSLILFWYIKMTFHQVTLSIQSTGTRNSWTLVPWASWLRTTTARPKMWPSPPPWPTKTPWRAWDGPSSSLILTTRTFWASTWTATASFSRVDHVSWLWRSWPIQNIFTLTLIPMLCVLSLYDMVGLYTFYTSSNKLLYIFIVLISFLCLFLQVMIQ